MLIPYFGLLFILSLYGVHRYEVIRTYFKYRKKLPKEAPDRSQQLPPVTIQLPLFNERYVVERLIEEVSKIDYPWNLLQVQILDDSTDETHALPSAWWRPARRPASHRIPSPDPPRRLQSRRAPGGPEDGHRRSRCDLRCGFRPPIRFSACARCTSSPIPGGSGADPLELPQRDSNVLTEIQAILLDGHFVLEHGARCGRGLFFNFNGTAGILRRSMIADAGGWQHDTLTEDSDSATAPSSRLEVRLSAGARLPLGAAVEMHGFQVQQFRWAKGLTQVARKLLPSILRADIPGAPSWKRVMHLTPNISYPMMMVVSR